MPLSFFTKQLMEIQHADLVSRINKHESGVQPLTPEAIADYRNDELILYKLLSGQYEGIEDNNARMHRHRLSGRLE